MGQKQQKKMNL